MGPMSNTPSSGPADVLLVEDNPGDVRLVQEAFAADGRANRLHVVNDGVEAVDFCFQRGSHTDEPRPDLVLLDLNIPRKDGEAVIEELRADAARETIPIIVLSGSDVDDEITRAYSLGANAYLLKSTDPDEFIASIRALKRFWLTVARLPDGEE